MMDYHKAHLAAFSETDDRPNKQIFKEMRHFSESNGVQRTWNLMQSLESFPAVLANFGHDLGDLKHHN